MTDASFILIKTSFPDRDSAQVMAAQLIERSLVACAQLLGPIESHFFWEGKLQVESEYLLLLKTIAQHQEKILTTIQRSHPYDTPELIVLPILGGSLDYLNWVNQQTTTTKKS